MGRAPSLVTLRALCVLALAAMTTLGLWRLVTPPFAELSHRMLADGPLVLARLPFDEALIGICAVALVVCSAWTLLVTALLVIQVVVQAPVLEQITAHMCPGLAQRIVLAGCGVALTTGLASPATADQAGVGGLSMPDRTVGAHLRVPRTARITVTAGDSLWSIAEAALPDQADDAEITAAWQAVWRANPDQTGSNPDLIFPGTTLQIPDLEEPDRKDHQ